MKKLKEIWKWLDGKKTLIGAVGLVSSYGIRQFAPEYTFAYKLAEVFEYGFSVFAAIGGGHKIQKKFLPGGLRKKQNK